MYMYSKEKRKERVACAGGIPGKRDASPYSIRLAFRSKGWMAQSTYMHTYRRQRMRMRPHPSHPGIPHAECRDSLAMLSFL